MSHETSLELIHGKKVSHVWLAGSALYIELGELSPGKLYKNGHVGNPRGEIGLFAGYGWRLERARSIVGGSDCTTRKRNSITRALLNSTIEEVIISSRIPELQIRFSSGLWLATFSPDPGQPCWAIEFSALGLGFLSVERGKVHFSSK